ncbi:hypothetical protein [Streptomyces sp. NPDC051577]|uniref:hypothetical protein n=1 Tax=Streptomyces sp. NPDC051577 TaxID=3155166 RepID=UPI00343C4CBD
MAPKHSTITGTARHRGADDGVLATRVPRQAIRAGAEGAPLFEELAREWTARGATVPGEPDPLWQRLVSWEHLQREIADTVRNLHLRGADPSPALPPPAGGTRRRAR